MGYSDRLLLGSTKPGSKIRNKKNESTAKSQHQDVRVGESNAFPYCDISAGSFCTEVKNQSKTIGKSPERTERIPGFFYITTTLLSFIPAKQNRVDEVRR
jgi:hypothetical protein